MQGFDYKELFVKFRYPILILLIGLILVGGGFFFFKSGLSSGGTKVEVLSATDTNSDKLQDITVEVAGEVITPGVYKLPSGSRIDDLLVASGGLTAHADRVWSDKYLNRASKLTDGQKVYIPSTNQQSNTGTAKNSGGGQTISTTNLSDSNGLVNINTASIGQLDSLPGIGQVYGQNIIEHRPYSTVEELVSKGAIKQSLLNKIKDKITIY